MLSAIVMFCIILCTYVLSFVVLNDDDDDDFSRLTAR